MSAEREPDKEVPINVSEICELSKELLESREFGQIFNKLFLRLGSKNYILSRDESEDGCGVTYYSVCEIPESGSGRTIHLFIYDDDSNQLLVEEQQANGDNRCREFLCNPENVAYFISILQDSYILTDVRSEDRNYNHYVLLLNALSEFESDRLFASFLTDKLSSLPKRSLFGFRR